MKRELELKHLLPYIPHGLDVVTSDGIRSKISSIDIYRGEATVQDYHYPLKWIKPLLRPMSELFENIVHNGEIVCVAELIANERFIFDSVHDEQKGRDVYFMSDIEFDTELDFLNKPFDLPYWMVEVLFKYHFDVFGLIVKGFAEPIKNK